jgi:cytochrome c oxidase subunit II
MKKPSIILAAALGACALFLSGSRARAEGEPKVIPVTAKRFEFVPHELKLKKGETVTLHVSSEDVQHGFFNRKMKIDSDIPAGQSADVTFTPQQEGKFLIICDHFCGSGHGNMHLSVEVE